MPPLRRVWSSWNYTRERGSDPAGPASLTYDMNRLQGLQTRAPLLVTLNRSAPLAASRSSANSTHPPIYATRPSRRPALPGLNGPRRTWFCGSYFGYGFHEDAVRSGV